MVKGTAVQVAYVAGTNSIPGLHACRAHAADPILDAYLLHVINHINASAARIKKNNEAVKAGAESDAPRDQGFTRAKVKDNFPL